MKLKGSMTVEAAIIFPTLIIAIFAIIFFAYYEQDIVVLRSEVRSRLIKNVAEDIDDESDFLKGGDEILFYLTYEDINSYKTKAGRGVSADVNFKILPFVSEYLDKDLTDGGFSEEYKAYIPQQFVRKIEAVESISEE